MGARRKKILRAQQNKPSVWRNRSGPQHENSRDWLFISGTLVNIAERPTYRKTSSISRTLVGNEFVDNSDVVGASPVGAAPTTSSFST